MKNQKERAKAAVENILIGVIAILVMVALIVLSQKEYGAEPRTIEYYDTPIDTSGIDTASFITEHSKLN